MVIISHDTIAAIATPIGEGGIGIVRISGPKALAVSEKVFIAANGPANVTSYKTFTVHYGHIIRRNTNDELIDEVLLTVMRAPRSYTKEDVVEISCHGGVTAIKRVLEEVLSAGARLAAPGEFTKRAFLNGRIDLAEAESVCDIIKARTDASLRIAVRNLGGGLSKEVKEQREKLINILRDIEAAIDFTEEDIDSVSSDGMKASIEEAADRLTGMLENAEAGMLIKEGITCVITGKPNVGKSSMLNALLRRNRAIVTHIPGTTRDTIEEAMNIEGVPVKLVDTAGIMKTKGIVERKGIEKTKECLKTADIIIFILDLSRPFDDKDRDVMKLLSMDKTIVIGNKSDLKEKAGISKIKGLNGSEIIKVSILKKKNIGLVEKAIADKIWKGKVTHPEAAFIDNIRHKKAIEAALKSLKAALAAVKKQASAELLAVDIRKAVFELGLITGESVDVDILDRIFAGFCIGK